MKVKSRGFIWDFFRLLDDKMLKKTICIFVFIPLFMTWCTQQVQEQKVEDDLWSELTCNTVSDTRVNCLLASTTVQPVAQQVQKNVLGSDLQPCSTDPMTWRYRDGYCRADENDRGIHVVCATLTDERLQYSKGLWNDLITPNPSSGFPWLKAWDNRCLCAARWLEAEQAWVKTRVVEDATHESMKDLLN